MKLHAPSLLAVTVSAVLSLAPGCVAFNVGKPEVVIDEHDVPEKQEESVAVDIVDVEPQSSQTGLDKVAIGLKADVDETIEKRSYRETWTIRKQKRLGVGLFPGGAEVFLMPEGALYPVIFQRQNSQGVYKFNPADTASDYVVSELFGGILTCGVVWVVGTVHSLLVAPFGPWECSHDLIETDSVQGPSGGSGPWTVSASTKVRMLDKYSTKLGVHTSLDAGKNTSGGVDHLGLFGVHKYVAMFVDGPERGPSTVVGTEKKREAKEVNGPYIVEFSIPELNHSNWSRVTSRETNATFPLPIAQHDCTVDATVAFRRDEHPNAGAVGELTRKALDKASERVFHMEVALRGGGGSPVKVRKLYEIVEITTAGDGKYVVRVEIKDKSKTFAIGRNIESEVRRLIREDYLGKNPDTPLQYIRDSVKWETEGNGEMLVYTGWAFSARPVEDGWDYNPDTRRGWIRLRITGGMPADDAKSWARKNIAAIISDKNVALEASKAPPSGAQYRSLAEKFEDGVLTVEFEAIE